MNRKAAALISQINRSQAVSIYGPGGIYELRQSSEYGNSVNSVMICGLDHWKMNLGDIISEPTLAKSLGVKKLLTLPPAPDWEERWKTPSKHVTAVRFPEWLVCSGCERLGKVGTHFIDRGSQPRCAASSCSGRGIPVRLISACYSRPEDTTNPGHVDDFPWEWWAHNGKVCDNPKLFLKSTGDSIGLAGLKVTCTNTECYKKNVGRTLQGVFGNNALSKYDCNSNRPWLKDCGEKCERPVRALMRGASNVYFAVTASVLSIPPNSSMLVRKVGEADRTVHEMWDDGDHELAIRYFRKGWAKAKKFDDQQIKDAFGTLYGGDEEQRLTEMEQKSKERTSIIEGRSDVDVEGSDFVAKPVELDALIDASNGYLQSLVLLDRLREVRAIRGFQRVTRSYVGDAYDRECAPIFANDPGWLPAIEVRGEGIYFELDTQLVESWQAKQAVKDRISIIHNNIQTAAIRDQREIDEEKLPTAGFVLIHTLTHLFINQLSLLCGYSSASLRERLYVNADDGAYGVLVYTSAPGADGTLGGLVRQGKPENFKEIFELALKESRWCSSDPLCIESQGQGLSGANLAACHACSLVSETSCEHNNMMLDRGLLIGTAENRSIGFFSKQPETSVEVNSND